jgi:hypothetical protein
MVECIATKLDRPVFNPIEVGDVNSNALSFPDRDADKYGITVKKLCCFLKAKGQEENKPGWILTEPTLRKRIKIINKVVPDFQRQPRKKLDPYQTWTIIRVHEDYYEFDPANNRQIAIAIRNENHKYTYEEYKNEAHRTAKSNRTERNRTRYALEQA